jgi:rhodanese-related sulfurtransferase
MKTITAREVRKLREAGEEFTTINTLDSSHFAATKIPDAINIPQSDPDFIAKVAKRAPDKEAPVIVYCANVNCDSSTRGAEKLIKAGYTNVMDMADGYQGWEQAFKEKEGGRKAKEDAPSKTSGRSAGSQA